MKYYAVKKGRKIGVYENWKECEEQIKGFNGAVFKSFSSLIDANNFIEEKEDNQEYTFPTCYVDGSFDKTTGRYSFGGILLINGKELFFKKAFQADEYSVYRNVAGEIKGASYIINYSIKNGIKKLIICYDYLGIEKWYTGEWKANSKIATEYVNFLTQVKDKIEVEFVKIKSHTNNKYNDIADKLAKEALGIK